MQRYVQTRSGDNRTSWDTLRYNTRMGLGMSLSPACITSVTTSAASPAISRTRNCLYAGYKSGVMHPRFTIHSWNDDHTVNEPWMYPGVTPAIRSAIELRYRLLPYFIP